MTAAYMLLASLPDGRDVKAVWNSKFHQQLKVYVVRDGAIEEKRLFDDLAAVDVWAADLGVASWTLHKSTRVSPFASTIRIRFPDAPSDDVLRQALERVAAGGEFKRIALELGADPVMARAWLLGLSPGHPAVEQMIVPGLNTEDIWGGQF